MLEPRNRTPYLLVLAFSALRVTREGLRPARCMVPEGRLVSSFPDWPGVYTLLSACVSRPQHWGLRRLPRLPFQGASSSSSNSSTSWLSPASGG